MMPTNRKRRSRGVRPELDADQLRYFADGTDFCFFWDEPERGRDWRAIRSEILADWIKEHPGSRPYYWWLRNAPEPRRRRLRGRGDVVPAYDTDTNLHFGIFRKSAFVDAELLAAVGKIGNHLVPFDENDPVRYESQAAFLRRHRLLARGEEARLTEADFADEVIR